MSANPLRILPQGNVSCGIHRMNPASMDIARPQSLAFDGSSAFSSSAESRATKTERFAWGGVMRGTVAKTILCDADIPPNLRLFIDVLLNGDREGYSNSAPPICPENVDERESIDSPLHLSLNYTSRNEVIAAVEGQLVMAYRDDISIQLGLMYVKKLLSGGHLDPNNLYITKQQASN